MFKKIIIKTGFLGLLLLPLTRVEAQQYKIMEAIPGFFDAGSSISFPDLVLGIYKFGTWTVGIAALFMITVGGFMYATSAGNTSSAGTAKRVIMDSLLGLAVAMTAYLGLRFINPDLVIINALKGGLSFTGAASIPSTPVSPETAATIKGSGIQKLAQDILNNSNIKLDGSGDCSDKSGVKVSPRRNIEEVSQGKPMTVCNSSCKTTGVVCSGSVIPSKPMLEAMLLIGQNKSYRVTSISGGQHGKNTSAHYQGKGVDIIPSGGDWNGYVLDFKNNGANNDQTFCEDPNESGGSIKSQTCAVKHHIHVSFVNR